MTGGNDRREEEIEQMMKQAMGLLVMLGVLVTGGNVFADGRILVSFDGGIGVIPAQNGAGIVNADGTLTDVRRNVVRGVGPAIGPWRIEGLAAVVDVDGRIRVNGRGLLLASGNSIGQNANQRVFATLICEAAAPFVERSSSPLGVALEPNGDFRIDDVLDSVASECPSPVLLIRASSGTWFAAGIVKRTDIE
jgi:hypothetical protein